MKRATITIFAVLALASLAATVSGPGRVRRFAPSDVGIPAPGFITAWTVTNNGSITLPLRSGYTYNMTVDYGDGTIVNVNSNNDPDATHTYSTGDSNRTVSITGTLGAWYFNNAGSKANFGGVTSWGTISGLNVAGLGNAFYGCSATNFDPVISNSWTGVNTLAGTWFSCTGIKNGFPEVNSLTNVTSLDSTWADCSGLTNDFPAISNLVKVTSLYNTWYRCTGQKNRFPEVNDLTNVTSLGRTWWSCSTFTNSFPSVDRLTKVTTLDDTWRGCGGANARFPEVNTLTNVTSISYTWYGCNNTPDFPSVSNLVKVTSMVWTWRDCAKLTNSVQDLLGDCLWITGQVKNVSHAFNGCVSLSGLGQPLVTAITNSPGYPTGYTVTDCFNNCTNLTDYATLPAEFL